MHNPSERHWQAVKWIICYLQKTVDVGFLFKHDDSHSQDVIGYVDFDNAGNLDNRRLTISYIFTLA